MSSTPFAACVLVTLAGCAHARPSVQAAGAVAAASRGVTVSDDIRKICKIEDTDRTPRFDFDSSNLTGTDHDVLVQVARCLTTGPLRGHSIQLIGRADPRGESEYNMTLGTSRSGQVDAYLVYLGVDPMQMTATSRGELDATGADECGWQHDRRVDVRLQGHGTVALLTPNE
jgi:peptidoglycan-associated lipoprotein